MDLGISGRRAAVAAASAGLGLACARALAAEGVRVALCGRDAYRIEAAASSIRAAGGDAVGLATEVAPQGVTVNSVQPGLHATDRLAQLYGGDLGAAGRSVPVGRVGDPDDFGAAVAFLCSEHARFITGTALSIDGGAYQGLM